MAGQETRSDMSQRLMDLESAVERARARTLVAMSVLLRKLWLYERGYHGGEPEVVEYARQSIKDVEQIESLGRCACGGTIFDASLCHVCGHHKVGKSRKCSYCGHKWTLDQRGLM